jgi:transketolase
MTTDWWQRLHADAPAPTSDISDFAAEIRRTTLVTINKAGLGHIGGDYSVTDILATLYGRVLRVDPRRPEWADRDRFILSKGHAAVSLYSTLALSGFFPIEWLDTFTGPLSALNGHPNRNKVPGVETNTGPLGHGFPVALGCALAAQLQRSDRRTYVVIGDGELQEGSNWEAFMYGGHRQLTNLTVIIDRNRLQQGDRTENTNSLDPLDAKVRAFGWEPRVIDGHDLDALNLALASPSDRPVAVIAETVKGKGVSFIEDRAEWHHKVPNSEQVALALEELSR